MAKITRIYQKEIRMKKIARIFQEVTGLYHVCDDSLDFLDARGPGYKRKSDAMRAAFFSGYTHVVGSGTYWGNTVRMIPKEFEY